MTNSVKIPTIYVPICDSNLWVLNLYSHLFNKFWPSDQKVVIMGFKGPDFELPKNFQFVSMAPSQDGGAQMWTRYIHDYLVTIEDEYLIFSLEDFFATSRPNLEILSNLYNHMLEDKKIGFVY
mgnify:CR=1 FL=1